MEHSSVISTLEMGEETGEEGGDRTPSFLPKGAETSESLAGSWWFDQGPRHEFEFPVSSAMSPQPEPQKHSWDATV